MSSKEFNRKIEGAVQKARAYLLSKYHLNEQDVQDVLQEASFKAMKNLKSFREKCAFETWLISICKNEVNSLFRRNKRRDFQQISNDSQKESVWTEPDVMSKINLEEKIFLIHQSLSKLSEKHREIIEITLQNSELSSQEIADLLKIPVNSARTRLFYAKKRLKKLIESYAHESNIELNSN